MVADTVADGTYRSHVTCGVEQRKALRIKASEWWAVQDLNL